MNSCHFFQFLLNEINEEISRIVGSTYSLIHQYSICNALPDEQTKISLNGCNLWL